jgi:hypothetical protein
MVLICSKKHKFKSLFEADLKETVLKEIVFGWIHLAQVRVQFLLWTSLWKFGCSSGALHAVFRAWRYCALDTVTNFIIYLKQKLICSLETLSFYNPDNLDISDVVVETKFKAGL